MDFGGKVGFLVVGAVINAFAAAGGAWIYFAVAMSGFNTSQQTLSDHMNSLQGSLDSVKQFADGRASEARGDLAREVGNLASIIRDLNSELGKRLEENSNQLASLNSTLAGMDKRGIMQQSHLFLFSIPLSQHFIKNAERFSPEWRR